MVLGSRLEALSFERPDPELAPEGFSFTRKTVRCARLDALLERYAGGRQIDFLKIDVDGAKGDVLSSFDGRAIRPTVVLVEAISPLDNLPNHEPWEPILLDEGYVFAAFDGINRFYVPEERAELVEILAYPMSVLDRYYPADLMEQRAGVGDTLSPRDASRSLSREQLERERTFEHETRLLGERAKQLERELARRLRVANVACRTSRGARGITDRTPGPLDQQGAGETREPTALPVRAQPRRVRRGTSRAPPGLRCQVENDWQP